MKKSLSLLRLEAEKCGTELRGHKIIWSEPFYHRWSNANLQDGKCQYCGMEVQLNDHPRPNGIDISGEAVALNCFEA